MTRDQLREYVEATIARLRPAFYVERRFRTNEEWDRVSAYEFRTVSLSESTEASLEQVLAHRSVALLGEPGSGKSTVAVAAVELVAAKGWVPLFGSLRSYTGNLAGLLANDAPAAIVAGEAVDGVTPTRVLVLDGFDEIRHEQLDQFVVDLTTLLQHDTSLRLLLTARQAFYETHQSRFANQQEAFYILDFNQRNIRRYIEHHGGGYDAFMAEVDRVELGHEIANPFALQVLFRTFREGRSLGRLRSEAIDRVVESLIASRPGIQADQQRRALRMLAVAMETASRNELTLEESVSLLQTATTLSAQRAETLLNDLTGSILVRTANGIAFQMRSYGEYLAAVELSDKSLDRVQLLVRHQNTLVLNESWQNCISYLAELHSGVRRQFSIAHADWMTSVSPAAFTEAERGELLGRLLAQLADSRRYLWRHPSLSIAKVARFVTTGIEPQLRADAVGPDVVRAANALVLLGVKRSPGVVALALPTATDRRRPQMLRGSATAALANAGDAALIQTLIPALDKQDQLHLSLLDCIGGLTDAAAIPQVLPLLLRTDALISGAFHRFSELRTPNAVDQLLVVLTAEPDLIHSTRLNSYAKALWESMAEQWEHRWAVPLARLIVRMELTHAQGSNFQSVTSVLSSLGPRGEEVAKLVLQELLAGGHSLFGFRTAISPLVTPAVAEWLSTQPNAANLLRTVAAFGGPEVRAVLAPHLGGYIAAQDEAARRYRQEQERREESERQQLRERQDVIRASPDILQVLGRLSVLEAKDWPDIDAGRATWMHEHVERLFRESDPARTTVWHNENQLTHQNVLPWLVRLTDRYALQLNDDVPLVQCLLALESQHIVACHRRHPFSARAIAEFERLLADPATPSGAVYNFLSFLTQTELRTPAINDALVTISEDVRRPEHIRSWAIRSIASSVSEPNLVALASRLTDVLRQEVEKALIGRQHRPTIERRLAGLVGNPVALRAGDVEIPQTSPLEWIGKITTRSVWPRLVQLREEALRLALSNLTNLLTYTMQRIDGLGLADVVRQQAQYAPLEWREGQYLRAFEIERETRLRNAQATPFDEILARLRRATSLGLFKIWCEGPTDAPTIQAFVAKLPDASRLDVVTDSLKGWTAVMNPAWTADRLADGCHDLIVILDGDKARDWTQHAHPFRPDAQVVIDKLTAAGVQFVVLERYGIENYFAQAACETVLGQSLAGMFPLPPYQRVQIANLSKNQNPRIAEAMSLADLANTDLSAFLDTVEARSRI